MSKTIPVILSDDLHRLFRAKLFQDDMTSKEFFLTKVQEYVADFKIGPVGGNEKPQNINPDSEVHTVKPIVKPKSKSKKSKGENNGETGEADKGRTGEAGGEKTPGISKGKGEPGGPAPRKKKGLWPWAR